MDCFFCAFFITGTQFVSYADIDTGTHSDKDSGKQSNQQSCGADGT